MQTQGKEKTPDLRGSYLAFTIKLQEKASRGGFLLFDA